MLLAAKLLAQTETGRRFSLFTEVKEIFFNLCGPRILTKASVRRKINGLTSHGTSVLFGTRVNQFSEFRRCFAVKKNRNNYLIDPPRKGFFRDNEINNINEHNSFKNPNLRGSRPGGYFKRGRGVELGATENNSS